MTLTTLEITLNTLLVAEAADDLYTHSLKKAKILCLEMCQKYGCLLSVEDSKTWKTVYSVCRTILLVAHLCVAFLLWTNILIDQTNTK